MHGWFCIAEQRSKTIGQLGEHRKSHRTSIERTKCVISRLFVGFLLCATNNTNIYAVKWTNTFHSEDVHFGPVCECVLCVVVKVSIAFSEGKNWTKNNSHCCPCTNVIFNIFPLYRRVNTKQVPSNASWSAHIREHHSIKSLKAEFMLEIWVCSGPGSRMGAQNAKKIIERLIWWNGSMVDCSCVG